MLADRGDLSSVDPSERLLDSPQEIVRLAAIETLTKIGTDDGGEALLPIAVAGSGLARAAREGLATMAGPRVEEAIAAYAATGELKHAWWPSACWENDAPAGTAEILLSYASDADEQIARAAFAAMADVADTIDAATLADLVAKAKAGGPRDSGVAALRGGPVRSERQGRRGPGGDRSDEGLPTQAHGSRC